MILRQRGVDAQVRVFAAALFLFFVFLLSTLAHKERLICFPNVGRGVAPSSFLSSLGPIGGDYAGSSDDSVRLPPPILLFCLLCCVANARPTTLVL